MQDIKYSDTWFTDVAYAEGDTHTVYGDYNNFYRAEPFLDDNNNGTWDFGEEFHDRNGSDSWDHQDNNYDSQLIFSWYGTFIDTTVLYTPDLNYEIIINIQFHLYCMCF